MIKVSFLLRVIKGAKFDEKSEEVKVYRELNSIIANIVSKFKEKVVYKDMLLCDNIETEGINNYATVTPQALSHTFLLNENGTYDEIFNIIKGTMTDKLKEHIVKELKLNSFAIGVRLDTSSLSGSYDVIFSNLDKEKMTARVECHPWDTSYPNVDMEEYINITGSDV
jgi:hypothetical protein|nr:MAG TPA: hypothetical protein [Caudoviricetes sp.]